MDSEMSVLSSFLLLLGHWWARCCCLATGPKKQESVNPGMELPEWSPNKPFLFVSWLFQVFVIVTESWLTQVICQTLLLSSFWHCFSLSFSTTELVTPSQTTVDLICLWILYLRIQPTINWKYLEKKNFTCTEHVQIFSHHYSLNETV
jgi:hypothetical protein